MKLLTGLFRTIRKKISLTYDNDMGAFRDKLEALVKEKDSLDDEALATRVAELTDMTQDLPDGEDKEKLQRYLEDFKAIKGQEEGVASEAAKAVADLFEKLDKAAMENDIAGEGAPMAEPVEEPPVEETPEEEPISAEGEGEDKVEDADPDPKYTLEEVYQFIKKRMAEDAEVELPAKEDAPAEDKCGVQDHGMPDVHIAFDNKPAAKKYGLDDFMRTLKGEKDGQ